MFPEEQSFTDKDFIFASKLRKRETEKDRDREGQR